MIIFFPLNPYNQQRQLEKKVWVYPVHLAMYATYLRNQGHKVIWGDSEIVDVQRDNGESLEIIKDDNDIKVPFNKLPYPDRRFTDAKNPRWQSYGNYKFHPATHMMASNLCWYGKCTFCIDTEKLKTEERHTRSVDHVMEEIDNCISLGYKEIFDDSGTFPVGDWLEEFCRKMQSRKRYIKIGCNMKPVNINYKMMADSGFRFVLFGIESANQKTLNKIKKGGHAAHAIKYLKKASDAGLEPHGSFMTGYPWEKEEDEKRTIDLCHYLLRQGYLSTAQASVYSKPREVPPSNSKGQRYVARFFDVYKQPKFWITKIQKIKRWEDFTYLCRGIRLVIEEKWRKMWK